MTLIAPRIPKTWNEIVELILRAVCVVSTKVFHYGYNYSSTKGNTLI